ncbi:MAG: methyltransferase domain-containing protein [Actinocatenispora sp.]
MPGTNTRTAVESAVGETYSAAARAVVPELCCPIDYDPKYLRVIPAEVLERDYGCGDPSRHVRPGETVLDLGSGSGKIAFIASQVVGAEGRVVGVDVNEEMLALARSAAPTVADAIGHDNVTFLRGRIQDLALDLDAVARRLRDRPVSDVAELAALEADLAALRHDRPLIADDSVDVVVSNCVLNLVAPEDKRQLFAEIFRVLRRGGRAVVSDIVSSVEVPQALRDDPELWSGCVSGALQEEAFLAAFTDAGFHGVRLDTRAGEPWREVDGIEFRSVTVVAYKGKQGECRDHGQAVIYKGPWKAVLDDDEHVFERGVPTAVCAKSFELYGRDPYTGSFELLEPTEPVDPASAPLFACAPPASLGAGGPVRRDVTGLRSDCDQPGCC